MFQLPNRNIETSMFLLPIIAGDSTRCGFDSWVGKILWRRKWQPTPVCSCGESHGQRSLMGYRPQHHKELDMAEVTEHICFSWWLHGKECAFQSDVGLILGWEDPLERGLSM